MSESPDKLIDATNPGNVPVAKLMQVAKHGHNPRESSIWQTFFLLFVVLGGGLVLWKLWQGGVDEIPNVPLVNEPVQQPLLPDQQLAMLAGKPLTLKDIPFNGEQAYKYLQEICAIGRRVSNSEGIAKQREYLKKHFEGQGAKVTLQEFPARDPLSGNPVTLSNIIVTWHPERKERLLLCAHYDTRPFPDQDPQNKQGLFVGANDGASGIALLMELGRHLPKYENALGVDYVFFDAEEWVYGERDPYFLGSEYFAKDYAANPPGHRYKWGVLLDMVGGKTLNLPVDQASWNWPDTQPLVKEIWLIARNLNVTEFKATLAPRPVLDDHLKLHDIGKIPCIDIIDFDYPHWHRMSDTPQNCSPLSLAKVGWVIQEWLKVAK